MNYPLMVNSRQFVFFNPLIKNSVSLIKELTRSHINAFKRYLLTTILLAGASPILTR